MILDHGRVRVIRSFVKVWEVIFVDVTSHKDPGQISRMAAEENSLVYPGGAYATGINSYDVRVCLI